MTDLTFDGVPPAGAAAAARAERAALAAAEAAQLRNARDAAANRAWSPGSKAVLLERVLFEFDERNS